MQRLKIARLLTNGPLDSEVDVRGWVRTKRESKQGFAFVELNDGSSFNNLQVVVDRAVPGYESLLKQLTTGSSVRVVGTLKASPAKGQAVEVHAREVEVYGTADAEKYPLQKKGHSYEFLRDIAHLRPRTNTFGAMARVRNTVCAAIHEFYQSRGFLYVHTPIITTSDCEGAGQMFQVTTLDLALLARQQREVDFTQDFFGKPASLTVSGQLEAETFACGLGDVYTFGPTFRAENSNTTRHLAEFWMVEPEMAFYDLEDNMQLAQEFIQHILRAALERCPDDMKFFVDRVDKEVVRTAETIIQNEFERVTYTEAIELLQKSGQAFEYPVEWGVDLQSEHERWLTETKFCKPVILYNYPRSFKPFYMRCNDDGKTVRAMDVLVPRAGEIIGGSQREERLDVLLQRMQECHLDPEQYWWYVDLRRYGSVPHAGFGLGLERVLLLLTGMTNIRDVIPFPRTPRHAEF